MMINSFFGEYWHNIKAWLTTPLFELGHTGVTTIGIVRFLLILICTVYISRIILRTFDTFAHKRVGIDRSMSYRINRLLHYIILALGLVIALSTLGFDLSNLVLIASALGVGLGFGLQSIFNNFISGIIILFESHLKIGDFIELESGIKGEIKEIHVRSTIIRTNDGVEAIIPNSELISNRVINWTLKDPYRRVSIPFSVAYGSDKNVIEKIVVKAAKDIPITLSIPGTPEPKVYLTGFGDNSMDFELSVWINEKSSKSSSNAKSTYLWMIDNILAENKILTASIQRELHIASILGKTDLRDLLKEKDKQI